MLFLLLLSVGARDCPSLSENSLPSGWNSGGFAGPTCHHRKVGQEPTEADLVRGRWEVGTRVEGSQIRGVFCPNPGSHDDDDDDVIIDGMLMISIIVIVIVKLEIYILINAPSINYKYLPIDRRAWRTCSTRPSSQHWSPPSRRRRRSARSCKPSTSRDWKLTEEEERARSRTQVVGIRIIFCHRRRRLLSCVRALSPLLINRLQC